MTSGGNNFNYFPENQLTKFNAVFLTGGAYAPYALCMSTPLSTDHRCPFVRPRYQVVEPQGRKKVATTEVFRYRVAEKRRTSANLIRGRSHDGCQLSAAVTSRHRIIQGRRAGRDLPGGPPQRYGDVQPAAWTRH